MEQQEYKYFGFISYNSRDTEWGKRVQRKLEHYRMPATLCSEHGWERTPIKPVFFAPTDIQPGGLTEELQERLKSSRNLIVICSPNSAQSEWVGKEIEYFHQLGRTKQIHFFIVDGEPHSGDRETECFNPVIDELGLPEILGANIHEQIYRWPWLNKERAYVQLISKLLGVEFDTIWQRHKRLLRQKFAAWIIGFIAVLAAMAGVWLNSQPVDVEVSLNETSAHNADLPPLKGAVVTITLDNEAKSDTIHTINESAVFKNIPHRFLNKVVRMNVSCQDFLRVDTTVILSKCVNLYIRRDETVYGRLRYKLWNPDTEQTAANAEIIINGHKVISDENGFVSLDMPLTEQKTAYTLSSPSLILQDSVIIMPCGESESILFTGGGL